MCKEKKSKICFISIFLVLSSLVLSKGSSAEININKRIAYIHSYDTQTGNMFFGKLGIDIGKNGAAGGELSYTYPLDSGHSVWNEPNKVILSPDGRVVIYKKEQPGAAKHKKHMNSAEEHFDKCGYDFGFSNLIAEKRFYFLWGFDCSAQANAFLAEERSKASLGVNFLSP